ncbi:formin-like protein 3 isoform X2 [Iris pallida]|uniref:Formin-like protein 3 isoform X2 n=1 Tax=Iris pallida TaxID=29817 RepID=A0AAX6DVX1_IRIPA|nr:formin-like protein 3 isoform X2 [Iris pallida]
MGRCSPPFIKVPISTDEERRKVRSRGKERESHPRVPSAGVSADVSYWRWGELCGSSSARWCDGGSDGWRGGAAGSAQRSFEGGGRRVMWAMWRWLDLEEAARSGLLVRMAPGRRLRRRRRRSACGEVRSHCHSPCLCVLMVVFGLLAR